MNRKLGALVMISGVTALLSQQALAGHASDRYSTTYAGARADRGYEYAEVVHVEPIVRYVTIRIPERECWLEDVYYGNDGGRRHRSGGTAGASIAGGLIGGVIGRQFGDGKGRDAMTVVGTLVGSAIARDSAERRRDYYYDEPRTRTVERCETRYINREEERIDGYRVTYVYDGREYTTRSASDPGDRIPIQVSVRPVGRY